MEYLPLILIIVVLAVWGFIRNRKDEAAESKREELVASGVLDPYRLFMAETVPALMQDYNCFAPGYLERFTDQYRRDGTTAKFTGEDLLPGVDSNYAAWVLSHCSLLASNRFNQSRQLEDAKVAGFDVELKVARANPNCSKVPAEGVFKPNKALVYPCADCKEDKPCDIWYKLVT